jgi:thymidylate synthase
MSEERWDHIYKKTLSDVLSQTETIALADKTSIGGGREMLEARNYQFVLEDPRDRILWNPTRALNVYGAIARFFWMLSGNDRLKDIAFYEPKVLGFSDDALTIPGSDYGKRLFNPEPGLDQVTALVKRLRDDPGTRRAAAVIYQPEDAVRSSKDIPCAFGLAFHIRGGRLHMTMIMRSNAAWGLLPYNVFEFTLLGELVSAMVGVPLGQYTHIALSMHLYKEVDVGAAKQGQDEIALASAAVSKVLPNPLPIPMPPMPPTDMEQLTVINKWETDLRYGAQAINVTNYRDFLQRCRDTCDPYWVQLCIPLLAFVLFNNKKVSAATTVLEEVQEPLRSALVNHPMGSLNVPGLEDDPILLQSRLNLFRFTGPADVPEKDREEVWKPYYEERQLEVQNAKPGERRRDNVVTEDEWERRHAELVEKRRQGQLL